MKVNTITWSDFLEKNKNFDMIIPDRLIKQTLDNLENNTDKDGFVIDSKTGKRVYSIDEDDIRLEEIGSIATGSKIFIKNNIASFSEFLIQKER